MAPPTYRLARDFVIPAGTEIVPPPTASSRWGSDFEAIVAMDRDHTAYLTLDLADGIATGLIQQGPVDLPDCKPAVSSENIVKLVQRDGIGEGIELDANLVLEAAVGELREVVVIGTHKDGSLYVATSRGAESSFALAALGQHELLSQITALLGQQ